MPNALVFIDKYTQVPRILAPIVRCIERLPSLVDDVAFHRLLTHFLHIIWPTLIHDSSSLVSCNNTPTNPPSNPLLYYLDMCLTSGDLSMVCDCRSSVIFSSTDLMGQGTMVRDAFAYPVMFTLCTPTNIPIHFSTRWFLHRWSSYLCLLIYPRPSHYFTPLTYHLFLTVF